MSFKIGKTYFAEAITDYELYGIYDKLIGDVDGELVHLSDWWDELAQEDIDGGTPEREAYRFALESIKDEVWVCYEGAKEISIFKGIAPNGGFDVFTKYECISSERFDNE